MSQQTILTLARIHGGHIEASRLGMLLFSFVQPEQALSFASATDGMLIRGLERGAVYAAVRV